MTMDNDKLSAIVIAATDLEKPPDKQNPWYVLRGTAAWIDVTQPTRDSQVFSYRTVEPDGPPLWSAQGAIRGGARFTSMSDVVKALADYGISCDDS